MRSKVLTVAVALLVFGCESKPSRTEQPPKPAETSNVVRAPLVDLTTASSLGAVRTAFNARKGEARFLTLLSPT